MNRNVLLPCSCAALFAAGSARADETIVIEDRAPDDAARDRDRALGDAPFVTVLHPDEHAATASVADALATTAGAQTRSLGGLGAFESVSVRGASPGHTSVLVDGVPLARIAAVTTDLGRFAMGAFGEVELYRGAVPVELGGAGVGGAVNLVTRLGRGERGERVRLSIGGGSHGARHARAHYGDDHGGILSSTTLAYQGATGDYSFFDDRGTPLNTADDGTTVRENNGFDQLDLASRIGTEDRDRVLGARAIYKTQGLPGTTAVPARGAELSTIDIIVDGQLDARVGAVTARQLGFALVERQVLRDPMGELGVGTQDRGYLTLAGGASTTWTAPLGAHRGTAGLELRGDRFRDRDRDGARADLTGTRGNGAVLAAFDFVPTAALIVTPAVRLEAVRTAPTPMTEGQAMPVEIPARWDTIASPRLSARARISDDVAIKGSVGRYVRLPTLLELFGDRGTILGSPELRPERGPSADVGAVWAPGGALGVVDQIFAQGAVFATRARDTIALISTAGFVSRAQNIGATQTYGGELIASARFARLVSVTASYTRLVSENRSNDASIDGKAVPRTPGHLLYARVDASYGIASAWVDAAVQSASFLDQANYARVPGRVLAGTGVRVELFDVGATLAIENLTGTRIVELPSDRAGDPPIRTALADLAGFPLPGRTFYLSLDWTY